MEKDSEALYALMKDYNKQLWEKEYSEKKEYRSKKRGIQAWCADMWAVLWNLWLQDKKVEIHPEMDFSWPYSAMEEWDKKAIQHYSGNIKNKEKFFKKTEYLNYMPWYDYKLCSIPDTSCSYKIVELIRSRKQELDKLRPKLSNGLVVIDGRHVTNDTGFEGFELIRSYLQKEVDVDISLLMTKQGEKSTMNIMDEKDFLSLTEKYERILFVPAGWLLDCRFILEVFGTASDQVMQYYNPAELYKVDALFSETFSKVLDIDLLDMNRGKFNTRTNSGLLIQHLNLGNNLLDRGELLAKVLQNNFANAKKIECIPLVYELV